MDSPEHPCHADCDYLMLSLIPSFLKGQDNAAGPGGMIDVLWAPSIAKEGDMLRGALPSFP